MNQKVRKVLAPLAVGALACSLAVATPMAANAALVPGSSADDITRIQGGDRYQTAINASRAFDISRPATNGTVIVANADAWADVIAVTTLAEALKANVLYTGAAKLDSRTKAELTRLGEATTLGDWDNDNTTADTHQSNINNVIVIGGEGVISAAVIAEIEGIKNGQKEAAFTVDRIGGADRYETALRLAAATIEARGGAAGTAVEAARDAVVANDKNLNLVASSQAALAKAQADNVSAISAYVNSEVAVSSAKANLSVIAGQLKEAGDADVLKQLAAEAGYGITGFQLAWAVANAADAAATTAAVTKFNTFLTERSTVDALAKQTAEFDAWIAQLKAIGVAVAGVPNATEIKADLALNDTGKIYVGYKAAQKRSDDAVADFVTAAEASTHNSPLQAQIDTLVKSIGVENAYNETQPAASTSTGLYLARDKAKRAQYLASEALSDAQTAAFDAPAKQAAAKTTAAAKEKAYKDAVSTLIKAQAANFSVFLATGANFADALAAGPAAANENGVVLLTEGTTLGDAAQLYVDNNPKAVIAIGGAAATAAGSDADETYVGADRYATAAQVAVAFATTAGEVALASGDVAADAVIAGAVIAAADGAVLLTKAGTLPTSSADYFRDSLPAGAKVFVFGGSGAVSNSVFNQVKTIIGG